jgi:hypothetical protein
VKRCEVTLGRGDTVKAWDTGVPGLVAWNYTPLDPDADCLTGFPKTKTPWVLIHAPSGLSVASGRKRDQVGALAMLLGDLGNWAMPVPEWKMVVDAQDVIANWTAEWREAERG